MPASYWAEALATATYLLNILPTKTLQFATPHFALHGSLPSYDHLRVFGCKCYPNLSATTAHKLAPRSVLCVFLGYSAHHKGYRCLDLDSNRVLISRHVVFDEAAFPFAERSTGSASLDFLDDFTNTEPAPIGPTHVLSRAGPLGDMAPLPGLPRAAAHPAPSVASQVPSCQPDVLVLGYAGLSADAPGPQPSGRWCGTCNRLAAGRRRATTARAATRLLPPTCASTCRCDFYPADRCPATSWCGACSSSDEPAPRDHAG